jgi:hypothetical protein
MGLKYERALIERIIHGVRGMAESVTIDIFKEWGALERSRKTLLQLGTIRFGKPTDEVKHAIEAIDELDRFDALNAQLLSANGWDELLAPPEPKPRKAPRRKKA